MSIIYKFDDIPNFVASEGFTYIHVTDGVLELDEEPEGALLKLIETYGGVRQAAAKAKATKKADKSEVTNGGSNA